MMALLSENGLRLGNETHGQKCGNLLSPNGGHSFFDVHFFSPGTSWQPRPLLGMREAL